MAKFRLHAQALTLTVLSGAAIWHYYDNRSNENADNNGNYNYTTLKDFLSNEEEKISWWI
jgi:hypothetical protein